MKIHAAFVIACIDFDDGLYASSYNLELNRLGLPGGKLNKDETARDAVIREAKEEGFDLLEVDKNPFYQQEVEGKLVVWFYAREAIFLQNYKEKDRCIAVASYACELSECCESNRNAFWEYGY